MNIKRQNNSLVMQSISDTVSGILFGAAPTLDLVLSTIAAKQIEQGTGYGS